MAMIQVTAARLREAAEGLQSLNGQFKNKAADLESREQALCQMWEGTAKITFHNAFMKDCGQMDLFYQLIHQYVQALLEIAARYEQAEARNAEIAANRSY